MQVWSNSKTCSKNVKFLILLIFFIFFFPDNKNLTDDYNTCSTTTSSAGAFISSTGLWREFKLKASLLYQANLPCLMRRAILNCLIWNKWFEIRRNVDHCWSTVDSRKNNENRYMKWTKADPHMFCSTESVHYVMAIVYEINFL